MGIVKNELLEDIDTDDEPFELDPPEQCLKCTREKEYSASDNKLVCPVCEIEWDPEVWDKVIMQRGEKYGDSKSVN